MNRVLYVECNEDGTIGGSHKILADLVTRLSPEFQPVVLFYEENPWVGRLRKAGIEVLTWEDFRAREVTALRNSGKLLTVWQTARGIRERRRLLRELDIDLLHLNNTPLVGNDSWLPAAKLCGIPCVTYSMGYTRDIPTGMSRLLMKGFDRVFPLSRMVQENVSAMGIAAGKNVLAYPGIDVEEIQRTEYRSPESVRAEFGVEMNRVLAVMVGNVREWKGQHVVIRAVAQLPDSIRLSLTVLLVGDPGEDRAYERKLRKMIDEFGLEATILLTGRRDDVPDLLEAADISIHSSVYPEPFGLVVLEGMAHGCAPIAADEGGPTEMLTADSGITFDTRFPERLADHLTSLVADPDLRGGFAEKAREEARAFDVRKHVQLVQQTYAELLA